MSKLYEQINKAIKSFSPLIMSVGYQIAIFNDKEIVYKKQEGFDSLKPKIKTNDHSMYMIGSNTKVFTAVSILQLMEDGKLSLSDDIKKYIPELSFKSLFDQETITIKDLLNHRSGITSDLYNFILDENKDYHDVVEALKDSYLTTKPSKMFSYSNVGYTLLGIIIERVSGLSYEEYIKEHICKKLDIQIEFLKTDEQKARFDNLSLCFNKKNKPIKDQVTTMVPAGSNTYIKLLDFVKFGQVFLNKGYPLLKESTYDLMLQLDLKEEIDNELSNVGYGLFHNNYSFAEVKDVYGHGGDTQCHHSMFNFIPSKNIGVIVLTNTETATMSSRILGIMGLSIYLSLNGVDVPKNLICKHNYVEKDFSKYLGKYATPLGIMNLELDKKGKLNTKIQGIKVKLCPCEDGYFQCITRNVLLRLLIGNTVKKIRFNFIEYNNKEIVLLEQTQKNQVDKLVFGSRYIDTSITESWKKAMGSYEGVDGISKFELVDENGMLKIIIDFGFEKTTKYLWIYNDNLVVTQGYGRETNEVFELSQEDDDLYLTCFGLKGKKKVK